MEDRKTEAFRFDSETDAMSGMDPVAARILDFIAGNYDQKIALADLEEESSITGTLFKPAVPESFGYYRDRVFKPVSNQKALAMLADEDNAIFRYRWKCELGTTSISAMSSKNIWDAPPGIPFKNFIKKVKYRTNRQMCSGIFAVCSEIQVLFFMHFTKIVVSTSIKGGFTMKKTIAVTMALP